MTAAAERAGRSPGGAQPGQLTSGAESA